MANAATNPPCCPPNSWPQLVNCNNEDAPEPKGKVVTVENKAGDNVDIYVVEPQSKTTNSKGCIMVLQDVYSVRVLGSNISADRSGAICDALADEGYVVALPSLFGPNGDFDLAVCGPDPSKGETHTSQNVLTPDGTEWFQRNKYEKIKTNIVVCAEFLQEKMGGSVKIGVIGFCYGNWAFSKASSLGDVDLACGVGCHPSTGLETFIYGGDETDMMKKLRMPTLFLAAGNDSESYIKEDGAIRAALEKTGGGVTVFPDMVHGWVSRGDSSTDEAVKQGVEGAMAAIVEFMNKHMRA